MDKLRALAAQDSEVARILHIAGQHRVRDGVTLLAYLIRKISSGRHPASFREPFIAACRRIEQCHFGRLLQPQVADRARFVWRIHPHVIYQALLEKDFVLQPEHLLHPADAAAATAQAATLAGAPLGSPTTSHPASAPTSVPLPGSPVLPVGWQRQVFTLRPGVEIQLTLPVDLTLAEAERLAHLLRASVH